MPQIHRFMCPGRIDDGSWVLPPDESRHAAKSLRLRTQDPVELLDGNGGRVGARVVRVMPAGMELARAGEPEIAPLPPIRPHLLLGSPDPPVVDGIVEHAVELGAWQITIFRAERTQVPPGALDRRLARWETLIVSAGKQSGNPYFPKITLVPSIAEALGRAPPVGLLLRQGAQPLREAIRALAAREDLALAVGPEGDFSDRERAMLEAHGLMPATLGAHTLRVETATLAALAALVALAI